ncbi:MAG: hypothetical protein GC159_14595 [Phycisphaera sp.]|nr:hypothetical protein [Phycisphaera sp.]
MPHRFPLIVPCALLVALLVSPLACRAAPVVYEGDAGPGKGRHIVFIASDHEYKSEETLPALARILAKHFGFKCTVVFGVDADGYIQRGASNVPGIEALDSADLLVLFTRFQNWPEDQMKHFAAYLDRAGPIVGLRTATHGFNKIPKGSPYEKFNNGYGGAEYKDGFGRQVLGEKWAGHYGGNHKSSTRLDIVPEQKDHPILRGVDHMWAQAGGYFTNPLQPSTVLAMAQPLTGMEPDSPDDTSKKPVPGAWVRAYEGKDGKTGRVFTSTYGASDDITNDGYRRMLINACFWAVGLDDAIKPDLDVSFVGPFNPTWRHTHDYHVKPKIKPEELAGWDTPILPVDKN